MEFTFGEFENLVSDNNDAAMATNLGELAEKHLEFTSAINHYSNAISYDPAYLDAYINRARCFTKLKQFDKAIEDYETLLHSYPEKDFIKSLIGNVYCEIGSYDTALKYQNEAVDAKPNRADNYYYRGITKSKANKIEGALFDFEYSLKLTPNQQKVLYQIGLIKRHIKDYQGAFEAFDKLVLLAPSNGHNLYNRGLINYSLQKFEESLNDLIEAHKLGVLQSTEDILKLFAHKYILNHQKSAATTLFRRLINTAFDNTTVSFLYVELGKFQVECGEFANAFESMNKALENNMQNVVAYELRGTINAQLGNIEEAISDYLAVEKLDNNFFNNSSNILLNLPILDKDMSLETKIILTERAVIVDPTYQIGYYNLGLYYRQADNIDKAIDAFKRAHELAPKSLDDLLQLCQCLSDKNDFPSLRTFLEKAIALGDEGSKGNLNNLNEYLRQVNKATK